MSDDSLKRMQEMATSTVQSWQKHKYLSKDDELLSLVLKGHLLVEDKLETMISIHFASETVLKNLGLTFAKKVILAEAICQQYIGTNYWDSYLWPSINELNRARNELAHNIEPRKVADRVANLAKIYDDLGELYEKSFFEQTGLPLPRVPSSTLTTDVKLRALMFFLLSTLDSLAFAFIQLDEVIAKAVKQPGLDVFYKAMEQMGEALMAARTRHSYREEAESKHSTADTEET